MVDKEILNELKNGNYSHFQNFYDQTSKSLFFTALMIIKDQELSNDIVQESYVKFFKTIQSIDENQNIHYYLVSIARNLAINEYHKRKREISNEGLLLLKAATQELFKGNYEVEKILSVLDNDAEREIVSYHVLFEYTFKEIGRLINKPLGTVLWIYNQAMKKLRERITL